MPIKPEAFLFEFYFRRSASPSNITSLLSLISFPDRGFRYWSLNSFCCVRTHFFNTHGRNFSLFIDLIALYVNLWATFVTIYGLFVIGNMLFTYFTWELYCHSLRWNASIWWKTRNNQDYDRKKLKKEVVK